MEAFYQRGRCERGNWIMQKKEKSEKKCVIIGEDDKALVGS